jgi:Cu-Zn family superoxide dismutase
VEEISVEGLEAGVKSVLMKSLGTREPTFNSAGGHFNPQSKKHGMMASDGHHAGDMPNLDIPASGELKLEVVNNAVSLDKAAANSLFKPEGTALVIHATVDDYKTDPTGNAGGRIACGVIQP